MKIKRVLYLVYYLKNLDKKKFLLFLNYTIQKTGKNKYSILFDVLSSVFIYNISILEYFQFRFFEKSKIERSTWAGTGFMYQYQKIMNPLSERFILDDKTIFYKKYNKYFVHHVHDLNELEANKELAIKLLQTEKLVLKVSDGKCGIGVLFIDSKYYTADSLISFMKKNAYDLAETYIEQHPDLMKLSPSGVNTVRIFTQLNDINEVELLGCRQRISVNSKVDNMAAGNLAAPIDELTGIINGSGVYSDITKTDENIHPITGVSIVGFQVPFWKECIELAKNAAKAYPQNRSIGWDIVVTKNGPGLIEGNHDWCKLVWQLPVKMGLKSKLEKYV